MTSRRGERDGERDRRERAVSEKKRGRSHRARELRLRTQRQTNLFSHSALPLPGLVT